MRAVLAGFNVLVAAFVLAPLAVIIWMSFTPASLFMLPTDDWSLRWYRAVLTNPAWVDAFALSLQLAAATSAIAVVIGFLAAYGIVRFRPPGSAVLQGLFMSPIIVPTVAFGVALLQLMSAFGIYDSFFALLMGHVVFTSPFVIRTVMAALVDVPEELEAAARNLGASRLAVLRRITVPLSMRGTLAGAIFAFIISFDEVTISIFITGANYQTLPVRIYNYLSDQIDPSVAAISTMLIVMSLGFMLVLERMMGVRRVVIHGKGQ